MSCAVLICGLSTFTTALWVHILFWRLRRPKNDMKALFLIFLFIPITAAIALLGSPSLIQDFSRGEIIAALLLHVAISCAYIQSYPPAQAESPSLKMLILIASHMPEGLTHNEVVSNFDNTKLVKTRFQDLLNNSLIKEYGGKYRLTSVARIIIRFFIVYRKILGLPFRGG